jgi:hypothetical protein
MKEADLLGIDLKELRTESFDHPRQVLLHHQLARASAAYWRHQNFSRHADSQTSTKIEACNLTGSERTEQ